MNKTSFIFAAIAFSFSSVLPAQEHEQDRLRHAGEGQRGLISKHVAEEVQEGLAFI